MTNDPTLGWEEEGLFHHEKGLRPQDPLPARVEDALSDDGLEESFCK